MLQDIDHMEVSCVFYIKVGTFDPLEPNKICVLTFTALEILMLSILHDLIFCICFIEEPGDLIGQTSPHVLSVKESHFYILLTSDVSCH